MYGCPECKSKNVLFVTDLETGDEETPGYYTSDPKQAVDAECGDCCYYDELDAFRLYTPQDMPPAVATPSGEQFYDFPLAEGIKFWRETSEEDNMGMVFTNVPHYFSDGSHYQWGYMGSGPDRLALNILETVLRHVGYIGNTLPPKTMPNYRGRCYLLTWHLSNDFKREVVSKVPSEGVAIPISIDTVCKWLEKNSEEFGKFWTERGA